LTDERFSHGRVECSRVMAKPAAVGENGAVEEGGVARGAESRVAAGDSEFEVVKKGGFGD
jgi:hypothetical protein